MLKALSFVRRYLFSSCRWMGAEANPGKVLRKIMFLSPSIALPQPFPSGVDNCLSLSCRVPTAAQKRDETLLQGQYLGHRAVLEAGLHPDLVSLHCLAACQTSNTLHCLLLPLVWQKALLLLSRPRDLHSSPLKPSSSPTPAPASSHPHFLILLGILYSCQRTALQSKAF